MGDLVPRLIQIFNVQIVWRAERAMDRRLRSMSSRPFSSQCAAIGRRRAAALMIGKNDAAPWPLRSGIEMEEPNRMGLVNDVRPLSKMPDLINDLARGFANDRHQITWAT